MSSLERPLMRIVRSIPRMWPTLPLLSSVRGRIIILAAGAGGSAWWVREHQVAMSETGEHAATAGLLQDARQNVTLADLLLERYIITGNDQVVPEIRLSAAAVESIARARAQEEARGDEDEIVTLNEITVALMLFAETAEQVIGLVGSGDVEGARGAMEAAAPQIRQLGIQVSAAADIEAEEVSVLRGRANEAAALAFWFAVIGGSGGVVIALAVAALIARSILRPLSSLKSAALAVAKGDLEMRAPVSGPQELAQLGTSLNQMTESLLDASKRRELEEGREQAEEMFKTLANSSPIGIFVAQDGKFQFVNPQFQTYTGYSEDELLDTECLKLVLPEDRRTVRENAIKMLKGEGSSPYEYRVITKGGETIWIMEKVASIRYQGRIATLGYYMDISERKQAEEIIKHLAYHDELTGLPNRNLLKDRLDIALAQARRQQAKVAMMFLDLDGFKIINDTLGHVKGDQILQMVGARLMGVLREGDTVARMGGDEFALLFPAATETEEALRIADRVTKGFDRPFVVDGQEFNVTASIGVALYPDHAAQRRRPYQECRHGHVSGEGSGPRPLRAV